MCICLYVHMYVCTSTRSQWHIVLTALALCPPGVSCSKVHNMPQRACSKWLIATLVVQKCMGRSNLKASLRFAVAVLQCT